MTVRRLGIAAVSAVFALSFLSGPVSPAKGSGLAVPANVNTSKFLGNQSETAIAIQLTNPQNVVGTSNVDSGSGLVHVWSTDGGATWQHDIIANGGSLGSACCDGQLASDEFGNIFLVYIDNASLAVRVATSTDGGATFHAQALLTPPGSVPRRSVRDGKLPNGDQPSVYAASGEVWSSWTSFTSGKVQASGAAVTGLGQVGAFSAPQSPMGHSAGDYGDTSIGPNGEVMLTYQNPTGGEGPATIYTALDPDGLGPMGFQPTRTVTTTNVGGFDYIPAQMNRSVDAEAGLAWDRTGGPHNGRLYLMYTTEQPQESSDLDIQLRYSDDQGATWSTELRVNKDATTRSQFLPRIALDQTTGNVAISWYDCRFDDGNGPPGDTNGRPNDDAVLFAAVSRDGGQTVSRNFRISAGVSNSADASSGLDYGDYEGLAYHAGNFYPFWADNSNSTGDNPDGTLSKLDLYTAKVHVP
jgi:hypothetical protein